MLLGIASSIIVAMTPLVIQGQTWSHYDQHDITIDFQSDDSLQRYVGPDNPITQRNYIPASLVKLISSDYLHLTKNYMSLRSEAAYALNAMAQALFRDIGKALTVVSSYRSYDNQLWINRTFGADEYRAKAGYSEHQLGLAVDLMGLTDDIDNNQATKTSYQWLLNNAHHYGFTQSYQKGVEIDGYHEEKWHRRFVGVTIATYLHDNNLTFTEFFRQHQY